jgi:Na+/H+-dicarboxylate symporter
MPLAFPSWETASFFSHTLVEPARDFDFLALYVPSNPFRSLSNGIVPAVVVFSAAVGLALMRTEPKGALLEILGTLEDALLEITNFVVRLSPYGVFAITAAAAGTMQVDEFQGLQVYGVAYAVSALLLSLWTLPVLLTALTPLRYRRVMGSARDALVTAFATGSVFVVLPILAARSKELLAEQDQASEEASRIVDVVVPVSFTLASAGKLLTLSFILFAGWLSGYPLSPAQYPGFVFTGIFSFFASTFIAVPFLLDLYRIPADLFQLFVIADNVVGNRFGAMLAAVHTLLLSLLAACGAAGMVTVSRRKLLRWAGITALLTLGAMGGVRLVFEASERPYQGYRLFVDRPLLFEKAPSTEHGFPAEPDPATDGLPALERIRERGALRVGYAKDQLPLAFRNQAGELVGLDIELAHALAWDLGVGVEFFLVERGQVPALLDRGALDIAIAPLAITPDHLKQVAFSTPYMEETLAFIVPDHRREEFSSRSSIRKLGPIRIGLLASDYYEAKIREYLPEAETVVIDSPRSFFRDRSGDLDALVYTAEAGAAWTLIYPRFTVAVPVPGILKVPVGFPIARREFELAELMDSWILLKQRDGTIEELFDYWIRGREPPGRSQRWSVMRDVLGWGNDR